MSVAHSIPVATRAVANKHNVAATWNAFYVKKRAVVPPLVKDVILGVTAGVIPETLSVG
jgi:hypothetical protein